VRAPAQAGQHGVSLVFSLITLAALSLAAVALVRSVDTGASILGNLSFKQDTLLATDEASRQAANWLDGNAGSVRLHDHDVTAGYRASQAARLDPSNNRPTDTARSVIDWNLDDCGTSSYPAGSWATCLKPVAAELTMANNLKARWYIERICASTGNPNDNSVNCAKPMASTQAQSIDPAGGGGYSAQTPTQQVLSQYYRVIVRVRGTRNAVSTTETLVHF
jgi:hypothetical protein